MLPPYFTESSRSPPHQVQQSGLAAQNDDTLAPFYGLPLRRSLLTDRLIVQSSDAGSCSVRSSKMYSLWVSTRLSPSGSSLFVFATATLSCHSLSVCLIQLLVSIAALQRFVKDLFRSACRPLEIGCASRTCLRRVWLKLKACD